MATAEVFSLVVVCADKLVHFQVLDRSKRPEADDAGEWFVRFRLGSVVIYFDFVLFLGMSNQLLLTAEDLMAVRYAAVTFTIFF